MTDVIIGADAQENNSEEIVDTVTSEKSYSAEFVKELKTEAKNNRIKYQEFQKKSEDLSKQNEELTLKVNTMNSKLQDVSFTNSFNKIVAEFNPIYSDVIALKIDKSKIELLDDGNIKDENQIKEQLKSIVENYPNLFGNPQPKTQNIDASAKGPSEKSMNLNDMFHAMANEL